MSIKSITSNLHVITYGSTNSFLIDTGDNELILIDTGDSKYGNKMIKALYKKGLNPERIKHILLTHCHNDHAGNLAKFKKISSAEVYAHPEGSSMIKNGTVIHGLTPYPGFFNRLIFNLYIGNKPMHNEPSEVDHEINGGNLLSIKESIRVIYAPGHSRDHLIYFWPKNGGVLFLGDIAANLNGLNYHGFYNNLELAKKYLKDIVKLDFDIACFGHGKTIIGNASQLFRRKWETD